MCFNSLNKTIVQKKNLSIYIQVEYIKEQGVLMLRTCVRNEEGKCRFDKDEIKENLFNLLLGTFRGMQIYVKSSFHFGMGSCTFS